jgi:hypothetical protein
MIERSVPDCLSLSVKIALMMPCSASRNAGRGATCAHTRRAVAATKAAGEGQGAAGADVRRVATPARRSVLNPTLVAVATSCRYLLRRQQQAGRRRRRAVRWRVAVGGLLHVLWTLQ